MNEVLVIISIVFILISILFLFAWSHLLTPRNKSLEKKKKKSEENFKEKVLEKKLEKILQSKVEITKRIKIENTIKQAGFNMTFVQFVELSILSGFSVSMFFLVVMKNPYMAIIFLFLGFFIPLQILNFLKNKRIEILEKQIGAFMKMAIKRYENHPNMHQALIKVGEELSGVQPISYEINKTLTEINTGIRTSEALDNMAMRTGNKYMIRFASYYKIASELGTDELRRELLGQAVSQYKENLQLKRALNEKISGPVKDSKVMIAAVPLIALYQTFADPNYISFMTQTKTGQIGLAVISVTVLIVLWIVNTKIGAPIE